MPCFSSDQLFAKYGSNWQSVISPIHSGRGPFGQKNKCETACAECLGCINVTELPSISSTSTGVIGNNITFTRNGTGCKFARIDYACNIGSPLCSCATADGIPQTPYSDSPGLHGLIDWPGGCPEIESSAIVPKDIFSFTIYGGGASHPFFCLGFETSLLYDGVVVANNISSNTTFCKPYGVTAIALKLSKFKAISLYGNLYDDLQVDRYIINEALGYTDFNVPLINAGMNCSGIGGCPDFCYPT